MNPRTEAMRALREAEEAADALPSILTIAALKKIKVAMQKTIQSQRRALEWLDAVETL